MKISKSAFVSAQYKMKRKNFKIESYKSYKSLKIHLVHDKGN